MGTASGWAGLDILLSQLGIARARKQMGHFVNKCFLTPIVSGPHLVMGARRETLLTTPILSCSENSREVTIIRTRPVIRGKRRIKWRSWDTS
jgi:hypothetical protein